jgi:hypothetical protein
VGTGFGGGCCSPLGAAPFTSSSATSPAVVFMAIEANLIRELCKKYADRQAKTAIPGRN